MGWRHNNGLELSQVNILGISLGGRIVLRFGAVCPQGVCRVVLISPMGLKSLRLDVARRAIGIALGSARSRGGVFQGMLDILLTGAANRSDPDLSRLIEEFYLFFRLFKQELITGIPMALPLSKGELQRFEPRAMLLVGEEEALFDPHAAIEKAERLLPNLEKAHLVAGTGHVMHYERPDVVNRFVLDYLRDGDRT